MSLYIKAKIVSLNPLTVGDDNGIIEQVVVIELSNGLRFGVLDGFVMQVKPDMIGKAKEISIIIPVAVNVKIIPNREQGIEPSVENPLDYCYHRFFGFITKVGVKDIWYNEPGLQHLICLNVGFADILVELHKEMFQSVKVGDFVEVLASMTTLLKIR